MLPIVLHFFFDGEANQAVQEAVQQTSSTLPPFPLALHFFQTASPQVSVVTEVAVPSGGHSWKSWTKTIKPIDDAGEIKMIQEFIEMFCKDGYIHGRKKE